MVSRLVDEDAGNRTSEEEIMSGSKGPDVSERVQIATAISRLTTAQMVLGREALYLPDDPSPVTDPELGCHSGKSSCKL